MTERLGTASEYTVVIMWVPDVAVRPVPPQNPDGSVDFPPPEQQIEQKTLMVLDGITSLTWQRRLDEVSETIVELTKKRVSARSVEALNQIATWRHEAAVYRDDALVWQGPVVEISETREKFTIRARDMLAWMETTTLTVGPPGNISIDLSNLAQMVVWQAMYDNFVTPGVFRDYCGMLSYIWARDSGVVWPGEMIALDSPVTQPNALDLIQEIAGNGMSYTTMGRSTWFMGLARDRAIGVLTDTDFVQDVEIVELGEELVTVAWAANSVGEPNSSEAMWAWNGARGTRDGNSSSQSGNPLLPSPYGRHGYFIAPSSTNGKEKSGRLSVRARARIWTHYPPPVIVRVPDRAQLSPAAPLEINSLACGEQVDVHVTSYYRQAQTSMRLASVQGEWNDEGEQIGISLVPTAFDI